MGAAGNSGVAKPRHRRNRYNAAELLIINPHLKWGLLTLIKLSNEMRKEELMEAVIKSDRSYAEIMAFIKGEAEAE